MQETARFTHTAGTSTSVEGGTKFFTAIPVLVLGTISDTDATTYQFYAERNRSDVKDLKKDYFCVAPPGKRVTCKVYYTEYRYLTFSLLDELLVF